MGRKRTPGLRNRHGIWHIEKQILGQSIHESTGTSNLEKAELILARRIEDEGKYNIPRIGDTPEPEAQTGSAAAGPAQPPDNESRSENNLIDLNSAPVELLETLPGIGPVKAKAIVEFREQNRKFSSVEDIKNVKGIGEVTYRNIQDLVTVSSSP